MKKSNTLIALYRLAEEVVKLENAGIEYNEELLSVLLQISQQLIKFNKEGADIVAIELASYFPIKTNEDLDDDEINVAFIEKDKTLAKNMN